MIDNFKELMYTLFLKTMKKLGVIICLMLVASAFIPIISVAFASKTDKKSRLLEKKVFIHYKKGRARPINPGKPPKPPKDDHSDHYDLLGKGVAWKSTASYVINPINDDSLEESFIVSAISVSAGEWDSHTSFELFGSYTVDYSAIWDPDTPDYKNEMVFGDYPEEEVIAVTVTWGYFTGPPPMREIIEFDIMFDTDFVWGNATVDSTVMDLQNIATHEIGHGVGLADIYDCDLETMYGISWEGDLVKRDLFDGDIAGLQKLYGK